MPHPDSLSPKEITARVMAIGVQKTQLRFVPQWLLAWLVYASDHARLNNGQVAAAYVRIANAKCALPFEVALLRGILCNILVCLAVWLACAGRSVTDKVLGIVFPITAFVAAGFEHSVANMYILSMGMLLQDSVATPPDALHVMGCLQNLIPVLLGNIIGGGVFVGLVYWAVYLREPISNNPPSNKDRRRT